MPAPKEVIELVKRFRRNRKDYQSGKYNETQVRLEFIDPFFEALGWDINNKKGYAEAYKDVVHEDQVKVGGITKAPDYGFRIGGTRKFFVEAKKPSINIKDDVHPAYQLRRYAWSAKLPLSILTDFEEMAVYDCLIRPVISDNTGVARVMYFTFEEYVEKWDEIAAIFSREAVLQGSFDRYAESSRRKRGTAEVDTAFLKEIEHWREILARNIALRNPGLTVRDLNFAVQRTIDRIIFLRIGEDRGLEPYGRLRNIGDQKNTYGELCRLYLEADSRYNSGLFQFTHEKDRSGIPDELTINLNIDDKVIQDIFRNLYYPDSPYEFSVLPADILGQVYEQFLGKVIRLTAGGQAKVEDKPEVKKAGGVYYTPTYIVDYIVQQTVGKLLEGKTPKDATEIKVLDPACGSGSFLLGAYLYLLHWHRDYYVNDNPEKYTRAARGRIQTLYEGPGGNWRLTTAEKRRILLNNIYGVDIDPQAVEVTKLSLLLKVLEGETEGSLGQQLAFFQERALPDLDTNIKCGNSLIGPDFYEQRGQQLSMFDTEEMYRINAFDWKAEFPEIISKGGFNAVIGNPPYIRIQALKEWAPKEVEFYKQAYISASKGNYDIYVVFVEKGLQMLNKDGLLGYILPHKFFNAKYGEPLRRLIAEGKHLSKTVHFGDQQIFKGATTYTCLLFLQNEPGEFFHFDKVTDLVNWRISGEVIDGDIKITSVSQKEWNFFVGKQANILDKLNDMKPKLGDISHLFVGLQTDKDSVFILDEMRVDGSRVLCQSKETGRQHWFENIHLKQLLKGSLNIRRYHLADLSKRLIFPYETINGRSVLIEDDDYKQQFPLTWKYLLENKERLSRRNKGRMGKEWYGYVYKKNHTRFGNPKILVPSLAIGSCFAIDYDGDYFFVGSGGGGGGGYGIILKDKQITKEYVLGILNSSLISMYLKAISTPFRGGYIALNRQYIELLPIRSIHHNNPSDVEKHDKMVALVESMLEMHKQLATVNTPTEKQMLQRQIETTDKQIDALVYELYELTEEEIRIVEEG